MWTMWHVHNFLVTILFRWHAWLMCIRSCSKNCLVYSDIYFFAIKQKHHSRSVVVTPMSTQPARDEGFLKAPLVATLWIMSDHGAQLYGWRVSLGVIPTHPVNIPCMWKETRIPGQNPRPSVEHWLTLFAQVSWSARNEPRPQKWSVILKRW